MTTRNNARASLLRRDRRRCLTALALAWPLAGCVAVKVGSDAPSQTYLTLTDPGIGDVTRRAKPIVPTLLVQPLAGDSLSDSTSIAYSRAPGAFGLYQFSSWTEQPVRRLPELLRARLETRGVAGAVGLVGDPLDADWLVRIGFDSLFHDAATEPGRARVAVTAELVQRPQRRRTARRRFEADAELASADAASAVRAMSAALARILDELVPWVEAQLQAAAGPERG